MIPTYNCAAYLRQTLASVLAQDPGPERMQIEVVDDGSTLDDPEAVVREMGQARVSFFRQPQNVGHVANFNSCLRRARGELVHLLHGDDRVRPGFYKALEPAFAQHPEIGAAFCRAVYMDLEGGSEALGSLEQPHSGVLPGWLERLAGGQRVATPSVVVRRAVYERLGGFDKRIRCAGEDWEMWVRIAAHYPVWYEPEALAEYRVKRVGSLTGDARGTPELIRDMRRATDIIQSYLSEHLPTPAARKVLRCARTEYAHWALNDADELLRYRRFTPALVHVAEAFRCSRSPGVARRAAGILLRAGKRWLSVRRGDELPLHGA
jgi:cellulose synthase/poly-beta-1,6-N-acetylglucosamine synthase-like glycosyltransferase